MASERGRLLSGAMLDALGIEMTVGGITIPRRILVLGLLPLSIWSASCFLPREVSYWEGVVVSSEYGYPFLFVGGSKLINCECGGSVQHVRNHVLYGMGTDTYAGNLGFEPLMFLTDLALALAVSVGFGAGAHVLLSRARTRHSGVEKASNTPPQPPGGAGPGADGTVE